MDCVETFILRTVIDCRLIGIVWLLRLNHVYLRELRHL